MAPPTQASPFPAWILVGWTTIFLVGTDLFVVSPFLPLIGKDIGRSPQSLTFLVSVFSLVYAIACPVHGRVAERFSPKIVLIFGVCALAAANLYTALAPGFEHLVASRAMAGFAAAAISPMIYTLTADATAPARRASRLAIVNSGLIVSLILGAPLGLLFGSMTEWRWVFLGLAASLALMVPINVVIWTRSHEQRMARDAVFRDERLADSWPLIAGMTAWAASIYMTYTLLGTALSSRLHLDVGTIAFVLSIFGVGATLGVLSGGKLADKIGAPRVVRFSFLAMGAAFSVSALAFHSGALALLTCGLFVIALSAYGFFPAIQACAASAFTARRSTVLGLMSSALYVGITLGASLGGVIFGRLGMRQVLVASAAIALVGAALIPKPPAKG